jgi:hypothetical protein
MLHCSISVFFASGAPSQVFAKANGNMEVLPFSRQSCYTGIKVGISLEDPAIFVCAADWSKKYGYPPQEVEGLKLAKTLSMEGDLSVVWGVLYNRCAEIDLPDDLPFKYCTLYSKRENVLIEVVTAP